MNSEIGLNNSEKKNHLFSDLIDFLNRCIIVLIVKLAFYDGIKIAH